MVEPSLDPRRLATSLADHLARTWGKPLHCEIDRRLAGGYSGALLYRVRVSGDSALASVPLVLRVVTSGLQDEYDGTDVFIQERLARASFPAAPVVASGTLELDPACPFVLMHDLGGRALGSLMPVLLGAAVLCDLAVGSYGMLSLATLLAVGAIMGRLQRRLHALQPALLAADAPEATTRADYLRVLRAAERNATVLGYHALAPAFEWLRANRPDPSPRDVVCHGDIHPFNIIVGARGIRGLLDWGNAAITGREFDLAIARFNLTLFVEPHYLPITYPVYFGYRIGYGRHAVSPRFVDYYEAFRVVEAFLSAARLFRDYRTGQDPQIDVLERRKGKVGERYLRRFAELTDVDLRSQVSLA